MQQIELQHSFGHRIIERGNELGELFRANTLRQHVEHRLLHFAQRLPQGVRRVSRFDRAPHLPEAHALQGKQVVFRNHAR